MDGHLAQVRVELLEFKLVWGVLLVLAGDDIVLLVLRTDESDDFALFAFFLGLRFLAARFGFDSDLIAAMISSD